MGLFRRKDRGIVDVGNDQVFVSGERADEMAEVAIRQVAELYDHPVAAEVQEAITTALGERYPDTPGRKIGDLLATTARMGYATREYEEGFSSAQAEVPTLAEDLRQRLAAGAAVQQAMADLSLALSDYDASDPSAPRSLDAIEGPGPMRDLIAEKAVMLSARLATQEGLLEAGKLPLGITLDDLLIAWRIGFLVRSCEASLPSEVKLTEDTGTRIVAVDMYAVRDAIEEWMLRENPNATAEDVEAKTSELVENTQYQLHPGDAKDDETGSDDEPRYVLVEFDHRGHVVPRDDPRSTSPDQD